MKSIFAGLFFLSTFPAFAGAKDCQGLKGVYTCKFSGEGVSLKITTNESANTLRLDIDGNVAKYVVDGLSHDSTVDDTTYVAMCGSNTLLISNSFRGKSVGMIAFTKSEEGTQYSVTQDKSVVNLPCRIK